MEHMHHTMPQQQSYKPLVVVVALIATAAALAASRSGAFSWSLWMNAVMAGYFLVFGGMKLLDVNAFADGFQQYDVVAKKSGLYAKAYPFAEVGLGLAFMGNLGAPWTYWLALVLSAITAIGVGLTLMQPAPRIQCVCLGTVLKVPLSTVTLAENLTMIFMSAAMLGMLA